MTHLETELQFLKSSIIEMWNLVVNQLSRSREALESNDRDLINEILANEKRVDAFELKINMDCENILALFNPVANDLRLILAVLKINYNLERIGDYANGITKILRDEEEQFELEHIKTLRLPEMYATALKMLQDSLEAFEKENNQIPRTIFKYDEKLDKYNRNASIAIAEIIQNRPKSTIKYLNLLSINRKLERVGDQIKNISEEIIFYLEAKVLRYKKKK